MTNEEIIAWIKNVNKSTNQIRFINSLLSGNMERSNTPINEKECNREVIETEQNPPSKLDNANITDKNHQNHTNVETITKGLSTFWL